VPSVLGTRRSAAATRGNPKDDSDVTGATDRRDGPLSWQPLPSLRAAPRSQQMAGGSRWVRARPRMISRTIARSRGSVALGIATRNTESRRAVQRTGPEAKARAWNICDEPRARARLTRERGRTKVPLADHGQICRWGSVRLHSNLRPLALLGFLRTPGVG
jgi:hypothetical protein